MLTQRVQTGSLNLGTLPRSWGLLDELYRVTRQDLEGRDARVLHDRMIDESQTSGRRTWFAAQRYLGIAWDNHEALISLLQHHGASQWAPWNLLRPTFEAAFNVAWLLDPDDSLERRRRGLRLEWLDEREHRTYYADLVGIKAFAAAQDQEALDEQFAEQERTNTEHDCIFRGEAEELGLRWPLPTRLNVLKELGELRHAAVGDGSDLLYASTWRTLSGMQHGRSSTMLRGSDTAHQTPIEGGVHALLSMNDEAFVNAAAVTNGLHQHAVMLYRERSLPKR